MWDYTDKVKDLYMHPKNVGSLGPESVAHCVPEEPAAHVGALGVTLFRSTQAVRPQPLILSFITSH